MHIRFLSSCKPRASCNIVHGVMDESLKHNLEIRIRTLDRPVAGQRAIYVRPNRSRPWPSLAAEPPPGLRLATHACHLFSSATSVRVFRPDLLPLLHFVCLLRHSHFHLALLRLNRPCLLVRLLPVSRSQSASCLHPSGPTMRHLLFLPIIFS